ncbi:MAG TPA: D-isomer specific 2-hydroxyacid dehydrogenase family protein [Actinomycetota bacterium]
MAQLLVVDPLLVTEEFGFHAGWAGPEHEVLIPRGFGLDDFRPSLDVAEGILTAHGLVTEEMIALAPKLRLIAKPGAGVDNIDVGAALARGIVVTNVQGVRGRSVAEHALFMIMYLARHGWMRDDPAWQGTTSVQLGGKTLGTLGLGEIGGHLARFGHGLGMDIITHTRTPDPDRVPGVPIGFVERDELLSRADFVVLCLPLTEETHHLINRSSLALMKDDAYLVNVSRGPVVATDDLLDALRGGRLGGAGLDVTEPEPLPLDHELRRLPNVLISPHNAGRTFESQAEALGRMRENVRLVLQGQPPIDLVQATI